MPVKSLSLFWVSVKAWKGTEGGWARAARVGWQFSMASPELPGIAGFRAAAEVSSRSHAEARFGLRLPLCPPAEAGGTSVAS